MRLSKTKKLVKWEGVNKLSRIATYGEKNADYNKLNSNNYTTYDRKASD